MFAFGFRWMPLLIDSFSSNMQLLGITSSTSVCERCLCYFARFPSVARVLLQRVPLLFSMDVVAMLLKSAPHFSPLVLFTIPRHCGAVYFTKILNTFYDVLGKTVDKWNATLPCVYTRRVRSGHNFGTQAGRQACTRNRSGSVVPYTVLSPRRKKSNIGTQKFWPAGG